MIKINLSALNPLELKIHNSLTEAAMNGESLSITQSAELCGCSTSKVSKFVKKLGFANYKQYMHYVTGRSEPKEPANGEFDRIRSYLDHFDYGVIDYIVHLIMDHQRIILLGYGASYDALLYWESKLRVIANKNVLTMQDDHSVINSLDENTLLMCFTLSGKYKSFDKVYGGAKEKGAYMLVVAEEYNPDVLRRYDNVVLLTQTVQPYPWKFHEKSRIIFFILFEEVMKKIVQDQYNAKALEEG